MGKIIWNISITAKAIWDTDAERPDVKTASDDILKLLMKWATTNNCYMEDCNISTTPVSAKEDNV